MMKTTLIKDLYGEIERLKGGERLLAMAEQIEKMGVTIETHYKVSEDLLSTAEEYQLPIQKSLKFIHLFLKCFDSSSMHFAVRLRKDLKDNASLFEKIGEHLQGVGKLCHSFLETHDKAVKDMRKKLTNSRALYASHIEALQNVVSMHKAILIVGVEDMSTLASSDAQSIENYLASEDVQADSIFDDLWSALSTHQGEMAIFARELHQEQTKSDAEKHIANISNLVSHHILRQKELVHKMIEISSMFILLLIQRVSLCSVSNSESAFKHYKKTNASVNEMCTKHVKSLASFIRIVVEQDVATNNEDMLQHIDASLHKLINKVFFSSDMSAKERESVSGIVTTTETHTKTLDLLRKDHSGQATVMEKKTQETFQERFM
ncbi:Kinesin-like protein KIN-5C, partial [Linum perenne]